MRSYLVPALLILCAPALAAAAPAEKKIVTMHLVTTEGVGEEIGTISLEETAEGLRLTPNLKGLPPGERGFHVHQNPDCGPKLKDGKMSAAEAAGPHYDPDASGKHEGPEGHGHKGDLPALNVDADGAATSPLVVERLTLADIENRSLMIHAGGDNYSDTPAPLGGGGARIACGVVR